MDDKITLKTEMSLVTCFTCGLTFGIPTPHYEQLARDARKFYCPNGHVMQTRGARYVDALHLKIIHEQTEQERKLWRLHAREQEEARIEEFKNMKGKQP